MNNIQEIQCNTVSKDNCSFLLIILLHLIIFFYTSTWHLQHLLFLIDLSVITGVLLFLNADSLGCIQK